MFSKKKTLPSEKNDTLHHINAETEAKTQDLVCEKKPDNIISLDISSVGNLQIGYQAETIFLKKSTDGLLSIHEFIGQTAYEYLGKVTSNRFKTTIRYGRREDVNRNNYVIIFLPENWNGELNLSTQYGHITSDDDWTLSRFSAETNEGNITLKTISAPRIHLVSSNGSIQIEHSIGFTDLHCTSGAIAANCIDGGAKLGTSSGAIEAAFHSMDNVVECTTLHGNICLTLPTDTGIIVDGISKRGQIEAANEGLVIKEKPGNIKTVTGTLGKKPYYNMKLSNITGNIVLR